MPDEWLTYAQIGERFGLKAEAARTRVRRLGWRTMPGNDGRTLALVPDDADLRPGGAHAVGPDDDRPDGLEHDRAVTAMLTAMLTALLTEATARADRAEQRAAEADKRADVAVALADRSLAQLAEAGRRTDQAEARTQEAKAEAEVLQRDLDCAREMATAAQGDIQAAHEAAAALRAAINEMRDEQRTRADTHAQELAVAHRDAASARQIAKELRRAEDERKARGRWARVRAAWRGE